MLFVASAAILVFLILGLVRLGDESMLASLPLEEQQVIQFHEAGRIVLWLEGPHFSKRFAGLAFDLAASDGMPVAGGIPWLRAKSSNWSTVRLAMKNFLVPRPGEYTLLVRGLCGQEEDAEHSIVFTKPYFRQTIGYILGIIASAGLMIGSLVLFMLQLSSMWGM